MAKVIKPSKSRGHYLAWSLFRPVIPSGHYYKTHCTTLTSQQLEHGLLCRDRWGLNGQGEKANTNLGCCPAKAVFLSLTRTLSSSFTVIGCQTVPSGRSMSCFSAGFYVRSQIFSKFGGRNAYLLKMVRLWLLLDLVVTFPVPLESRGGNLTEAFSRLTCLNDHQAELQK
jgi:hypothetical protein